MTSPKPKDSPRSPSIVILLPSLAGIDAPPATLPLPHTQGLPPEVLAVLLHRELVRVAAILDQVSDLEAAENIQLPVEDVYRLMALGTAALTWLEPAQNN